MLRSLHIVFACRPERRREASLRDSVTWGTVTSIDRHEFVLYAMIASASVSTPLHVEQANC